MTVSEATGHLPRRVTLADDGPEVELRLLTPSDREALLAFARSLPPHDLLFLRRDITDPDQIDRWLAAVAEGRYVTLLAWHEGRVTGYATVSHQDLQWMRHIAELRVLIEEPMRRLGLGRILTQEAFRIALGLGAEKMVAQMTIDQRDAIEAFRGMGFEPEAVLRDHVKDRDGRRWDLVVLSHDVASFANRAAALGIDAAFRE